MANGKPFVLKASSNVCLAVMALLGGAILLYGMSIPAYTDPIAASEAKWAACDENGVVDGWHDSLRPYETLRHDFMQAGISIVLWAGTLWLLAKTFGSGSVAAIKTPRKKWQFIALGLVSLAVFWFGFSYSYSLDALRGEFPSCADSLGIPLSALITTFTVLTPVCLVAGGAVSFAFGELPAKLFDWSGRHHPAFLAIGLLLSVLAVAVLLAGALSASTSSFLTGPAHVVAAYLFLSTGAAIRDRQSPRGEVHDE